MADIFHHILAHKVRFIATFFAVFVLSYGVLYAIDFVPEAPATDETVGEVFMSPPEEVEEETEVRSVDPYPERVIIDALDREIAVLNPQSSTIAALDAALLEGAVRHPDSADLHEEGTMVLFGHSSYLPVIHNQNFKAFNGLQNLVRGDTIRVQSSDAEYVYRVERVYQTKASEAEVVLDQSQATLTLVTCNSFGSKDDRFIVEAEFVEARAL